MELVCVKQPAHTLAHAPNLLLHYGASQRLEKPESEYLKKLPNYLRDYSSALAYPPYQTFIGNLTLDQLKQIDRPWYEHPCMNAKKIGKFGVMISEEELYGLMKLVDVFDLVCLEEAFSEETKRLLLTDPVLARHDLGFDKLDGGMESREITSVIREGAAPLYLGERIVGCVKAASEQDENQTAHLMLELIANKASGVLTLAYTLDRSGIKAEELDFIIECSEEIAGDVYNRGGGGIGKSLAETVGCVNATGYDLKSFCAAPVVALIQAYALVSSGVYDRVAVVGGGSVSKLGMNARRHVEKGMPALEDVLGGIGIILSEDDGVSPTIKVMGKQDIWASHHIRDMLASLVVNPLRRENLRIPDVDLYAPELQIPEILGRDIPLINYRYIADEAIRLGQLDASAREDFIRDHGTPGFAPQQGHVPSGVPIIAHIVDKMISGKIKRVMVLGKGSLFLSRLTKLHDGVSIMIENNPSARS